MGIRSIKRNYTDRYARKHGLNQRIYSIPKAGDVIVVNEHPMRWADSYIKCDGNNQLLIAPNERFIGRVVAVTKIFVTIEIYVNPCCRRTRAVRVEDFRLAFYRFAVVEEECLKREWSYRELDLGGDEVLDNVLQIQELIEVKKLF